MKRGHVPTVEEWAKLKQKGWTVESWNAEMDRRRELRENGYGIGTVIACCVAGAIAAHILFVLTHQ